jgi:hypothetical protein
MALGSRFSRGGTGELVRVVGPRPNGYINSMISKAQRIVLADHARLPWRFFGRLMACVQARL